MPYCVDLKTHQLQAWGRTGSFDLLAKALVVKVLAPREMEHLVEASSLLLISCVELLGGAVADVQRSA